MNKLHFTLFHADLSGTVLAANLEFEKCTIGTQLHGGFGEFRGRLPLDGYNAYQWYEGYHNARLKVWDEWGEVGWEGRLEDISFIPGYGVGVVGFGYWRNCFDVPMKDEDTWATGTHYPEDIIEVVIERCCRQIEHNFVNFASVNRNVAPYKIEQYRYPHEIIREVLEGGDKWGNQVYFAVWEDRLPYVFVKSDDVNWYVRLRDCDPLPKLSRSMEPMANAVICEYSVEGEAGDVNDEGTATGERGNNYITLTDTEQGWDEGQWDRGFDVAIVGGTGEGQIRDILRTRLEADVVDSGRVDVYDTGVSDVNGLEPQNFVYDEDKNWSNHQWTGYWVEIVSGPCAGQKRRITGNDDPKRLRVCGAGGGGEEWEKEDGEYPNWPNAGATYLVYKADEMGDKDKSWAVDEYNNGYVVEVVKGRGVGQRRNITDTKQVNKTDGDGVSATWNVLVVEPDWDVLPDGSSYYEIHRESEVVEAGKATGGDYNTLEDTGKSWTVDGYNDDYEVVVMKGNCVGQKGRIVDTTATVLTVEPLWDDDVPDDTSEYEIRVIGEKEDEEAEEGSCTQLVVTTAWTTQPDGTSGYEVRQKEEGGLLERSTTRTSGRSVRDIYLCRKKVFSLGTTTPGEAERVAGRLKAELRDPRQRTGAFSVKRVFNTRWVERPLISVRAGDVVEIVDMFEGQEETEELDALRRFFIIRTSYDQQRQVLSITPDTVEAEIATLIASGRR